MRDNVDPYKILGLDRATSLAEIEAAYREKALKYHPDRGGDAWPFQQVHAAYEQIKAERAELNRVQASTAATARTATTGETRSSKTTAQGTEGERQGRSAAHRQAQSESTPQSILRSARMRAAERRNAVAWLLVTLIVVSVVGLKFALTRFRDTPEVARPSETIPATRLPKAPQRRVDTTKSIPKVVDNSHQKETVDSPFAPIEIEGEGIPGFRRPTRPRVQEASPKPAPTNETAAEFDAAEKSGALYNEGINDATEPVEVEKPPPTPKVSKTTLALIERLAIAPDASERAGLILRLRRPVNTTPEDREAAVGAITKALDDLAADVRQAAVLTLRSFGPDAKQSVPTLIAYYRRETDLERRMNVLQTLGFVNDDSSQGIQLLIELARGGTGGAAKMFSPRYEIGERLTAVDALGHLGPKAEKAVAVLLEILKLSCRDMPRFDRPFEHSAIALANIGISGRGVERTLRQLKAGDGIRPAKPQFVERARVIADKALRTLGEVQQRQQDDLGEKKN